MKSGRQGGQGLVGETLHTLRMNKGAHDWENVWSDQGQDQILPPVSRLRWSCRLCVRFRAISVNQERPVASGLLLPVACRVRGPKCLAASAVHREERGGDSLRLHHRRDGRQCQVESPLGYQLALGPRFAG